MTYADHVVSKHSHLCIQPKAYSRTWINSSSISVLVSFYLPAFIISRMATTIKLLDLPQEIIVIILREHFVGLSVNVKAPGSIFGQARQPGYNESAKSSQHWLGIGLSTKRLYPTAQTVFLEQATFHCNSVNNNNLQNEYIAVRQLQLVRHLATNLSVLSRIDNPEVLELVFPKIQDILVKGTLKVLVFSDRICKDLLLWQEKDVMT